MTHTWPGRKVDYKKLDEIGFDVVDARFAKILDYIRRDYRDERYPERAAAAALAKELGVAEFNLRLWMRRQRTVIFLAETDPAEVLDLIASGKTAADIAHEYDLNVRVIEEFIRTHCARDELADARDAMAEMRFTLIRDQVLKAKTELEIKQAMAAHNIDQRIAAANSRRYSEDKNVRINAGAGMAMEISFVRRKDEEAAEP